MRGEKRLFKIIKWQRLLQELIVISMFRNFVVILIFALWWFSPTKHSGSQLTKRAMQQMARLVAVLFQQLVKRTVNWQQCSTLFIKGLCQITFRNAFPVLAMPVPSPLQLSVHAGTFGQISAAVKLFHTGEQTGFITHWAALNCR